MPYEDWDGVGPLEGLEDRGYCTHMSVLFLSWHRPYLALYEVRGYKIKILSHLKIITKSYQQILYGTIQFIATQFEGELERSRYVAAAQRFRIPYWDWAVLPTVGESVYPASVQSPSVDINGPAGLQTIANPLYSYSFHPLNTTEISTPQVSMGLPMKWRSSLIVCSCRSLRTGIIHFGRQVRGPLMLCREIRGSPSYSPLSDPLCRHDCTISSPLITTIPRSRIQLGYLTCSGLRARKTTAVTTPLNLSMI